MTLLFASHCVRVLVVLVVLATISGNITASAQMFGAGSAPAVEQPIGIPKELTPELVDGMLSRLIDGQIRELLHSEIIRRADEQDKASETEVDTLAGIEAWLVQMAERIETRVVRWAGALADLGSRRDKVDERMALAEHGIFGMIASWLILVAAGVVAALARNCRGLRLLGQGGAHHRAGYDRAFADHRLCRSHAQRHAVSAISPRTACRSGVDLSCRGFI